MRIIKNKQDVSLLTAAGVVGSEFASHLNQFIDDLQVNLDEIEPDTYRFEDCGYTVILEGGDNVRDLSNVGLNKEDQGLLGCVPEWFEILELDGVVYYRFLELYNNSFGVIFYTAIESHDEEVEQWLAEQLDES